MPHPKKRVRLLADIINLKIGDITDRILEEIIHDLTPYKYKPLTTKDYDSITLQDVVNTDLKWARNREDVLLTQKHSEKLYVRLDEINNNEIELYNSGDVISDIILNEKNTMVKHKLINEVTKEIPANYIRNVLNETPITRRMKLLRRKTIARETKKIIRIIFENQVCMNVEKDDVEQFILKFK